MVFLWKIYGFFYGKFMVFLWFFYGKFTPLLGEGARAGAGAADRCRSRGRGRGRGAAGRGRGRAEGGGEGSGWEGGKQCNQALGPRPPALMPDAGWTAIFFSEGPGC